MSGQRHPREHGSPANNDAHPDSSSLPPQLHGLMLRSPGYFSSYSDESSSISGFSTGDRSLPPITSVSDLTAPRELGRDYAPSTSSHGVRRLVVRTDISSQSTTPSSEDFNERQHLRSSPAGTTPAFTPSSGQLRNIPPRDESTRYSTSRFHAHPQLSSTHTTSSPTVHQTTLLPYPPSAAPTYPRSHSTDYYTDSSNASAASSGGRPPQSTASSGSSHTSVRAEMSVHARRPGSVGPDPNSILDNYNRPSTSHTSSAHQYHHGSQTPEQLDIPDPRPSYYRVSATRGTARHSPALERRESNPTSRSVSSASTFVRERSSSPPFTGYRTTLPTVSQRLHLHHSYQDVEEPRDYDSAQRPSTEIVCDPDEFPVGQRPSRVYEYTSTGQRRSRATTVYRRASESSSQTEGESAPLLSTAHRTEPYGAPESASTRNDQSQDDRDPTSLPWYRLTQGGHHYHAEDSVPNHSDEFSIYGPPRTERATYSTPSASHETTFPRHQAHRTYTTSQLRGPGNPGQSSYSLHSPSVPTPTPRSYNTEYTAAGLSRTSQLPLSLSAPTPGYASNPAEALEERLVRRSPEVLPTSLSAARSTFMRRREPVPTRVVASPQIRRATLPPEASASETRQDQYSFPPEAQPRHATISRSAPSRPSPVEHDSPTSAKRARTSSSPASTFDFRDYEAISSSPAAESASSAGPSARDADSSSHSQHTSIRAAVAEEREQTTSGTSGKRKKSPISTPETGRPRGGKGKRAQRSYESNLPSSSTSQVSTRLTEEELAHIAAFSGDYVYHSPIRQHSDIAPSYHSDARAQRQEQSVHSRFLHDPVPHRSATLDAPGEREPPPPYEEVSSSRASLDKGKDAEREKTSDDETDSEDQSFETRSTRKEKGEKRTSTSKGNDDDEKDDESTATPASQPSLFVIGAPPPPEERRGRSKIEVACKFCRIRKMKCDGVRPSCGNCVRKEMECEYATSVRRRGPGKKTKQKAIDARPKRTNKRLEEAKAKERKKEQEEALRLENLRAKQREARELEKRRTGTEQSEQQEPQAGPSQLVLPPSLLASSPPDIPDTPEGQPDLFLGLSPLSPMGLPPPGGPLSPSAPGELSNLRMPDLEIPMDLTANMSGPESMDVRMASPPALSPTILASSPPPFIAEASAPQISLTRPEVHPHRSSSSSALRQPRQGSSDSITQPGHLGASSSRSLTASRSSTRGRSRDVVTPHSSVTGTSAGEVTHAPDPSSSNTVFSQARGGGSTRSSMSARDLPSGLPSQSASVRGEYSSSGHTSYRPSFSTIPTPAQVLSATSSLATTSAPVVPSQNRPSEPVSSSIPSLTPEQIEAIARQAVGTGNQEVAAGGHGVGVSPDSTSSVRRSSLRVASSTHMQMQSVAGSSASASASVSGALRLSVRESGIGSESLFVSASPSAHPSTGIREPGSVSIPPESRVSASVVPSLAPTGETAELSSEDDTNKGKSKLTRTKRRREGGDVSPPSSTPAPGVSFPAFGASMSQTTFSFSAPGPLTGSASEAFAGSVSARQVETLGREEEGYGRAHSSGFTRPGDDSRSADNYGSGPLSSSTRPSSSTTGIGRRRVRVDSFEGHYGGYEAHEEDPVSGEKPRKRAKEDPEQAGRGRSAASAPGLPRRAGGARTGEGEDTELEEGEIREPTADPSSQNRPGNPSSSSRAM